MSNDNLNKIDMLQKKIVIYRSIREELINYLDEISSILTDKQESLLVSAISNQIERFVQDTKLLIKEQKREIEIV